MASSDRKFIGRETFNQLHVHGALKVTLSSCTITVYNDLINKLTPVYRQQNGNGGVLKGPEKDISPMEQLNKI